MRLLVLDTETLGLADPSVYDFGYLIYDTETGLKIARDYITKEIFEDTAKMKSAYYCDKLPIYNERLENGYCKMMKWTYILRVFQRDINKYKPNGIYAYNSPFDNRAIATTCDLFKTKNPLENGISDIWKGLADPHITETEDYKKFCENNGFMTKHKKPRCQAKAETVYRYLTGQLDYLEEHTALEDSKIELVILLKALELSNA